MKYQDIFLSAITEADGRTVNVGYLVLLRSGQVTAAVIAAMVAGAFVEMYLSPMHSFNISGLGSALGSLLAGYGAVLGAMGVYLWGDSRRVPKTEDK